MTYIGDKIGAKNVKTLTRSDVIAAQKANIHRTRFANYSLSDGTLIETMHPKLDDTASVRAIDLEPQAANEAFESARTQALDTKSACVSRVVKGSIHDLCILYYPSVEFRSLQATTQKNYRRQTETFRSKVGDVMVRSITRQHIFKVRDA